MGRHALPDSTTVAAPAAVDPVVPLLPATGGVGRSGDDAHREHAHTRRRRSGSAADVIATLTAELAATHPGLLEGGPHRRHGAAPARGGAAPAGRRGLAAAATGWRVPARTPIVLVAVVALGVLVTDQSGAFSSTPDHATGASAAAVAHGHTASATTPTATSAAGGAGTTAGDRGDVDRVSRAKRDALPQPAASPAAAAVSDLPTPAAAAPAAPAAPPSPVSTMKPGQTVPGTWVRPSPTGIYNSCFCGRWGAFHEGIDFAAPLGTPILAVGDGTVIDAGPASGFGNWVVIQHDDGDVSIYGHMRYYYVQVGQHVTAGQEIAVVGEEGQATGPHLHLGVRLGGPTGPYTDPVPWLAARGIDAGAYDPGA